MEFWLLGDGMDLGSRYIGGECRNGKVGGKGIDGGGDN